MVKTKGSDAKQSASKRQKTVKPKDKKKEDSGVFIGFFMTCGGDHAPVLFWIDNKKFGNALLAYCYSSTNNTQGFGDLNAIYTFLQALEDQKNITDKDDYTLSDAWEGCSDNMPGWEFSDVCKVKVSSAPYPTNYFVGKMEPFFPVNLSKFENLKIGFFNVMGTTYGSTVFTLKDKKIGDSILCVCREGFSDVNNEIYGFLSLMAKKTDGNNTKIYNGLSDEEKELADKELKGVINNTCITTPFREMIEIIGYKRFAVEEKVLDTDFWEDCPFFLATGMSLVQHLKHYGDTPKPSSSSSQDQEPPKADE